MKKSSLYTRGGDQGQTALVDGSRVDKDDLRINLYGSVDELNSCLGAAWSFADKEKLESTLPGSSDWIASIQKQLFTLGSQLACPAEKREGFKLAGVTENDLAFLEKSIDELDSTLPKLTQFILPGGSQASGLLHMARTICRRTERLLISFNRINPTETPLNSMAYLNRLSDFLFVFSRVHNHLLGTVEPVWP